MAGVVLFRQVESEVLSDLDLSGPLAIVMALGTCLLLAGKLQATALLCKHKNQQNEQYAQPLCRRPLQSSEHAEGNFCHSSGFTSHVSLTDLLSDANVWFLK